MTLFELAQKLVFGLLGYIFITGLCLIVSSIILIIDIVKKRKQDKKAFDKIHPVEYMCSSIEKRRFKYGKWKFVGKDQNDFYLYERIK